MINLGLKETMKKSWLRSSSKLLNQKMPIADHFFDENDNIWFNVVTPEFALTESFSGQQLLCMNPEWIELYMFVQTLQTTSVPPTPTRSHLSNSSTSTRQLPLKTQYNLEQMVVDYCEVEHYAAALDLAESILSSGRMPTTSIVLALVDALLKDLMKIKDSYPFKERLELMERTSDYLIECLRQCGADVFEDLWSSFDSNRGETSPWHPRERLYISRQPVGITKVSSKRCFHPEYKGFAGYDGFWDFVASCFGSDDPLQPRLFLLEALLAGIEVEYWQKRGDTAHVQTIFLISSLNKDSEGAWRHFETNLDILFSAFRASPCLSLIQTKKKQIADRLFNLIISLSYYDGLLSASALALQTFTRASKLPVDQLQSFLQTITFRSFTLRLTQHALALADWSNVPEPYQAKRRVFHGLNLNITNVADNWKNVVLETMPTDMDWEHLYWHVTWVITFYKCITSIYSFRWNSAQNGSRIIYAYESDDVGSDKITPVFDNDCLTGWQLRVDNWISICERMGDSAGQNLKRETCCLLNSYFYSI